MRVAVVGTGYVGLVSGTCFAEMGNTVTCVDIDKNKIEGLNNGVIPIYEPGLKELIAKNIHKTLFFSTNLEEAISKSDFVFIAVGTPMSKDGSADLSAVFQVATAIGKVISEHKIIVSKSTVPIGTTLKVKEIIQEQINTRGITIDFDVASNPEFLKEGAAINDFMKPDRIVIGAEKEEVFKKMKQLYSSFFRTYDRFIEMDIKSAEMTKYAANAMLATKISFMNEMANICEKVGADVNHVRVGIGSDSRIGYDFMYPGIGYGGTCFPKDISALIKLGKDNEYTPTIISSVHELNKKQKEYFFDKIVKRFSGNLEGLTFGVWGLSYKPETDDMREAPSVYIINKLLEKGASVKAYDQKAMKTAKKQYFKKEEIVFAHNKMDAIQDVDALLLLTEWKEFRLVDFDELKKQMRHPIIFDGRNQYRTFELEKNGFEYYQIGKL